MAFAAMVLLTLGLPAALAVVSIIKARGRSYRYPPAVAAYLASDPSRPAE